MMGTRSDFVAMLVDVQRWPGGVLQFFFPETAAILSRLNNCTDSTKQSLRVPQRIKSSQIIEARLPSRAFQQTSRRHSAMTTVTSGTTVTVSSGQTLDGVTVLEGGRLWVHSGGTITNTFDNVGDVLIDSGGLAIDTTAIGKEIQPGVYTGGDVVVYSGGNATGTTLLPGGQLQVLGTVRNTLSVVGFELIFSGGTAIDTTLTGHANNAGGGYWGTEWVYSGGTAIGTTLHAGAQVLDGGTAINTTIDALGWQIIKSGGTATATTISGGVEVIDGFSISGQGMQEVDSGGTASGTIVNNGGELSVSSGGVATDVTLNGGREFVGYGAENNGAKVNSGGLLGVNGTATNTTVDSGGRARLDGRGIATHT